MTTVRMSIRPSMLENGTRVLPEVFKHRLLQMTEENLDSMQKIWKEAGYEEVECQRLLGDFLNKIKSLYSTELDAEKQILDHAKAEVSSKCTEYTSYCEQLGRPCNINHIEEMNYTDRLSELERLISSIAGEVSERQDLLDTEVSLIHTLVQQLGDSPPREDAFDGPAGTPLLSDTRLELMRRYVAELEGIKEKRVEEVSSLAGQCAQIMSEIMYAEEGFNTMDDSELYLSLDKNARLQSLQEEKERRRVELGRIGADIARLWTLLRIPSVERDAFSSSFKMNLSMETLSKGVDELQRLQEERAHSLGKIVGCIREDIEALWTEMGIETEEARRAEFALFFEDVADMDDNAVEHHEEYFTSLRGRVEELRPLLQRVARREAVVQERIDLEHLQMNPERLTARGPNAREERKREEYMSNRVKNLDKITKELLSHIATWEETNGPFLYGGDRYCDRVSLQDEHYVEIRDSLRNARKKKDGKVDQVMLASKTLGAASKRASVTISGSSARATPAKHGSSSLHPPQPPLHRSIPALAAVPEAPSAQSENAENEPLRSSSSSNRNSDGTEHTSLTVIKERPLSTDSHTVIRQQQDRE